MLDSVSEHIRDCLQHAEDCARKAAAQTDPRLKQDFLDMERRWLFLARSYEFTERLNDLSDERAKGPVRRNRAASGYAIRRCWHSPLDTAEHKPKSIRRRAGTRFD